MSCYVHAKITYFSFWWMICCCKDNEQFSFNDEYAHIKYVVNRLLCNMKKQVRNDLLLKSIGQRLRQIRQERELSQEKVLFDADIYLTRIEAGRLNVTVSTLSELCRGYQIKMKDLFAGLTYDKSEATKA